MTALDLVTLLSQAIYVAIFFLVLWGYVRAPTPAHLDMTIFFGILAFVVVESRVAGLLGVTQPAWFTDLLVASIIALPYVLLRLVDDFTTVPGRLKGAAAVVAIGLAAISMYLEAPYPVAWTITAVLYIAGLSLYCGIAFVRAARHAEGVTRRRLQAVSLGTILFAVEILASGLSGQLPDPEKTIVSAIGQVLGLISAVGFFVGFAPPAFLRRAWQAPELRNFLERAASLPRLPTTLDIVRELERGAAAATGSQARIALWQEDDRKLRTWTPGSNEPSDIEAGQHFSGRAFEQQRTIFSSQPVKDDPQGADLYRRGRIGAVVAAPITAGERRVGSLVLYAERPPIFAQSDTELANLLADQAAVILESRALIDHAAKVRAREEATRLKEDFLSAAAHDLKTPLTTVVAQAQFLERKAVRDPSAPSDLQGLQRIVREGQRLAALVTDLLDAARLEQGRLVSDREPVDPGALLNEGVSRQQASAPACERDGRRRHVGNY